MAVARMRELLAFSTLTATWINNGEVDRHRRIVCAIQIPVGGQSRATPNRLAAFAVLIPVSTSLFHCKDTRAGTGPSALALHSPSYASHITVVLRHCNGYELKDSFTGVLACSSIQNYQQNDC